MTVPAATVNQYYTGIFRQAPSAAVSAAYQAMPTANDALNSMLSAANVQVDPVVRLYQTAFNRVPDSPGFTAWVVPFSTNQITLQQIANGFTQSTEFTALYPTTLSNAQYVGALYWNILQRAGEDTGIQGWVNALNSGALTRAQVLLGFSESGEFKAKIEPNVNAFLTNCANNTETYTGSLFDQGPGSVTSYSLTTNVDTIVTTTTGTNIVNGTIRADAAETTLNPGDSIDGTKGTTTVSIVDTANSAQTVTGFTMTGVNTFKVQNSSTGGFVQNFDLSGATGLANVAVVNSSSTAATVFDKLKNIVGASVTNSNGNVDVVYAASAVSGTADSMNVTINGYANTTSSTFTANGIETINLTSASTASGDSTAGTRVTVAGNALKSLVLSGDAAARITTTLDGATGTTAANAGVVNASAMTGALNIVLSGYTKDYLSVTGGSGNDTVDLSGRLGNKMTVAGGTGTDTLVINSAASTGSTGAAANVTGFETIQFSAPAANVDQDMSAFDASVTRVNLASSDKTLNLTRAGAQVATLGYTGDAGSMSLLRATNSTSNAITVAIGSASTDASRTLANLTLNNEETVTVTSAGKGAANVNTVTALNAAEMTALTLSGATKLVMTGATAANLTTIDASAMTAGFEMGGAFTNNNSSVTGGSGNDSLFGGTGNDTIVTGEGNNTVDAGNGRNAVTGGSGNDQITSGTGNDTISAGAGNDYITPGSATDSIDAGDGDDKIAMGGADFSTADVINGGAGTNTLNITAATTLTEDLAKRLVNIQQVSNISGTGDLNVTLTDAVMTANGVAQLKIANYGANAAGTSVYGSTATTTVDASALSAANSIAVTITNNDAALTPDDSLAGGKGNDTFTFVYRDGKAAAFDADDTVIGGEGTDTVTFNAATAGVAIGATLGANFTGVDKIVVGANAGNTVITSNDANLAAYETLTVDASAMTTTTSTFNFNGAAEATSTTAFAVTGATGANTLTGGAGNDALTGGLSGDELSGGAGNDTMVSAGGADIIDGGDGKDSIDAGSGSDDVVGGAGNDSIVAGTGNDTVYGDAGADSINLSDGGVEQVGYNAASESRLVAGAASDAAAVAQMDTVTAFDFGASASVASKFLLPVKTAGMSVGTFTLATSSLKDLAANLAGNTNFNTLFTAGESDAVLLTVSAGTAAGTYLVVNQDGDAGYSATGDLVVKLDGALNTDKISATNNFEGIAASLTATYTVGTTTLALAGTPVGTISIDLGTFLDVTDSGFDVSVTGEGSYVSSAISTIDLEALQNGSTVLIDAYGDTAALTVTDGVRDQAVSLYMTADNTTALTGTLGDVDSIYLNSGVDVTMKSAYNAKLVGAQGTNTVTFSDAATAVALSSVVETYALANAVNSVTLGAAAQNITGNADVDTVAVGSLTATGTLALAAGANVVSVNAGNIAGATISATGGTWGLTIVTGSSATVNAAQLAATSGITAAGTETVSVNTTAGALTGYTLASTVESWNIGVTGNGNNSVTLGAVGQSVTFGTGNDTVTTGTPDALTGTLNGGTGTNTIVFEDGDNLSGATISNFGVLSTDTTAAAVGVTMTGNQWNGIASKVVSAGANAVTTTFSAVADATIVLDASYTKYLLANGTNSVDAGTEAANYSITGGTGSDTIAFADTLTADDTVAGGTGTDTIVVTGAATGSSAISAVEVFTINYSNAATFTTGAINSVATVGTSFNASGSVAAVTFNAADMTDTDAYSFTDGAGNDVVTLSTTDASRAVSTVNITNGGADKVTINNTAIANAVNTTATITGFVAGIGGDQVSAKAGADVLNAGFQANTTGGGTPAAITVAGNSILEVGSAVGQLVGVTSAGALALANAAFTKTIGTDENYLVVIYGNNNAYLFEMKLEETSDVFDAAELVGVVTNVTADAMTSANFF